MAAILVMDDEPALTGVLVRLLNGLGHRAQGSTDAREGLLRVQTGPVDLVLLDLVMPEMGGLEVLEKIRAIDPELPVLIVTGNGSLQSAIEALRLGADDCLLKPLEIAANEFRVRHGLERRIQRRRLQLYEQLPPVRCGCHRIRLVEDEGDNAWVTREEFFRRRTGRAVSHGYCPDCCRESPGIDPPATPDAAN